MERAGTHTEFDARELTELLPAERVLTDPESLENYAHDDAEWAPYVPPLAVVLPHTTSEVAAVVKYAAARELKIVARGTGTGLSGAANAVENCLVISFEQMAELIEIDVDERFAVVQPGMINDALRAAVAEVGLWYPPDPASSNISSIGGNVATNAGGLCCVKYGVTRDYIRALTVVLADGEVVHVGHNTAKGVTGYDLVGLLVGSEGTLGIVTEITVKLLPLLQAARHAVLGYFNSLEAAGEAVAAISQSSRTPGALELLDHTCLQAVAQWKGLDLPQDAQVLLLARVDEPGAEGEDFAQEIAQVFSAHASVQVREAHTAQEADDLFLARRLSYPSLERLGPVLTEDVCVPKKRVPEMLARIQATAGKHDVKIANIAHAGDGNLHPLIIAPEGDEAAKQRAMAAFDEMIADCLDLGGTVTGEHGVGLLKLDGAARELPPRVLQMHADIKKALDPQGMLNPGKAFPTLS